MESSLDVLVERLEGFDLSSMKILKATLEYEADTDLLASKLADDIKFICQAEDAKFRSTSEDSDQQVINGALRFIWAHIFDIARVTPPDHQRQDCLVKTLESLRQEKGTVPGEVCLQSAASRYLIWKLMNAIGSRQVGRAT